MGPGGMDALVTLGAGDMRRSLNILQSASMAFGAVDEDAAYLCTGSPLPRDIEAVVGWLLNEDFNEAFEREGGALLRGGAALESNAPPSRAARCCRSLPPSSAAHRPPRP